MESSDKQEKNYDDYGEEDLYQEETTNYDTGSLGRSEKEKRDAKARPRSVEAEMC